jgi:hypothetical protein
LADAIGGRLPKWVWSAAIHLPTQTFKAIRGAQHLANLLGTRVIQEKRVAAREGLDITTDLFGQLREYLYPTRPSQFFFNTLLMLCMVERTDSGETKNALAADEIVAQTAIFMFAGQDRVSL